MLLVLPSESAADKAFCSASLASGMEGFAGCCANRAVQEEKRDGEKFHCVFVAARMDVGELRGPLARHVHEDIVAGDLVEQRQKLIGRGQALAVPTGLHVQQRIVDAQMVVTDGAAQDDEQPFRFGNPLKIVPQVLRVRIERIVEFHFVLFGAVFPAEVLAPIFATFRPDSTGCLKSSSLRARSKN